MIEARDAGKAACDASFRAILDLAGAVREAERQALQMTALFITGFGAIFVVSVNHAGRSAAGSNDIAIAAIAAALVSFLLFAVAQSAHTRALRAAARIVDIERFIADRWSLPLEDVRRIRPLEIVGPDSPRPYVTLYPIFVARALGLMTFVSSVVLVFRHW